VLSLQYRANTKPQFLDQTIFLQEDMNEKRLCAHSYIHVRPRETPPALRTVHRALLRRRQNDCATRVYDVSPCGNWDVVCACVFIWVFIWVCDASPLRRDHPGCAGHCVYVCAMYVAQREISHGPRTQPHTLGPARADLRSGEALWKHGHLRMAPCGMTVA
jgi:hypothetical protein